jgi:hypothetical protein
MVCKAWMPAFAGGGAKGSVGAERRWKGPGGMTGWVVQTTTLRTMMTKRMVGTSLAMR